MTTFLPIKKDFTSDELLKLITAKVTDENGHKCRLKFTVCFELSDGCNPTATLVGTSEWIKQISQKMEEIVMTDIKHLTQAEIQEIIDGSNHTSYASIKQFHDDGLLEVFPSADDVWSGYGDDEKLKLSTGKVVLFIGG